MTPTPSGAMNLRLDAFSCQETPWSWCPFTIIERQLRHFLLVHHFSWPRVRYAMPCFRNVSIALYLSSPCFFIKMLFSSSFSCIGGLDIIDHYSKTSLTNVFLFCICQFYPYAWHTRSSSLLPSLMFSLGADPLGVQTEAFCLHVFVVQD